MGAATANQSDRCADSYLTENIHYQLDARVAWKGLQLFYRYAAEIGALPAAPELRFVQSVPAGAA